MPECARPEGPFNWPRTKVESYSGLGSAIKVLNHGEGAAPLEFIVIAPDRETLTKVLNHIGGAQFTVAKAYRCDVRDNDQSIQTAQRPPINTSLQGGANPPPK